MEKTNRTCLHCGERITLAPQSSPGVKSRWWAHADGSVTCPVTDWPAGHPWPCATAAVDEPEAVAMITEVRFWFSVAMLRVSRRFLTLSERSWPYDPYEIDQPSGFGPYDYQEQQ